MDQSNPSTVSSSKLGRILWGLGGFVLGIAVVCSLFEVKFPDQGSEVWVLLEAAEAGGVKFPAGTRFVHNHVFSEGFYRATVNLNIYAPNRDRFAVKQDAGTDNQSPYWLEFKPDPSKKK